MILLLEQTVLIILILKVVVVGIQNLDTITISGTTSQIEHEGANFTSTLEIIK